MKLFIAKNIRNGDKKAFEVIKKQVLGKPDSLIGLAVGKTTDGLHKLISKDAIKNKKAWSRLKIFQIDENLGLKPTDPLSFNHEIKNELKSLIKLLPTKNIFLIDGKQNPRLIVSKGYNFIKKNNGIDLIILGIGPEYDPNIAYNTTGKSSLNSRFRVVDLHPKIAEKIKAGKGLPRQTPTKGITLGIRDILNSKKALLIAYGKEKANSLKIAFKKVNIKKSSASALLLHKDLVIVADKGASSLISKSYNKAKEKI